MEEKTAREGGRGWSRDRVAYCPPVHSNPLQVSDGPGEGLLYTGGRDKEASVWENEERDEYFEKALVGCSTLGRIAERFSLERVHGGFQPTAYVVVGHEYVQ